MQSIWNKEVNNIQTHFKKFPLQGHFFFLRLSFLWKIPSRPNSFWNSNIFPDHKCNTKIKNQKQMNATQSLHFSECCRLNTRTICPSELKWLDFKKSLVRSEADEKRKVCWLGYACPGGLLAEWCLSLLLWIHLLKFLRQCLTVL